MPWTQVPLTIDAAVAMRYVKKKPERIEASTIDWNAKQIDTDFSAIEALKEALHFSILITYAQGLALLTKASKEYDYDLNLETIAKIWRWMYYSFCSP
jgi:6-phosphogluconate dehydrogenase